MVRQYTYDGNETKKELCIQVENNNYGGKCNDELVDAMALPKWLP